ncbi:hypothetical protein CPT75_12495 [Butyrivibrio fibrisolvens]|uniref:Uncharacterized protein n=2 Tax=Butyrivibrio fibrisolvens TaxID=831 RepID=A0A317G337_BUTFI|nr:hypothetical protein CPT75_12495 [Butyrivibrio fibrisolvens]
MIMYYAIFCKIYYFFIILYIVGIFASIYFLLNKSYWDKFDFLRDDRLLRILYKSIIPILVIGYTWFVAIPIIRDKTVIDSGEYCVQEGIVSQAVTDGGLLGLFKTIIVTIDKTDYEFSVAYAEEGITKGDIVNITYLPHSKYAVIEKP